MNIALPRTRTGHKAPYVAALIAALSALAIVASAGIWQLADSTWVSGNTGPGPAARISTFEVAPSQTSLFVYVVDSDEQADLLNASLARAEIERASSDPFYSDDRFLVIKATSASEEQDVYEIVDAWISGGANVHLLDVRGR